MNISLQKTSIFHRPWRQIQCATICWSLSPERAALPDSHSRLASVGSSAVRPGQSRSTVHREAESCVRVVDDALPRGAHSGDGRGRTRRLRPEIRKKTRSCHRYCFAGPVTLNLRAEVTPASKNVASATHGEKLEVLQIRRRFVRVRTPRGDEGWTEVRNLLGPEQMEALGDLAGRAAKLPSQGEATVYTPLNIHTEPNRFSTSFYRITEGVKVDVVGHQLVPKAERGSDAPTFQIPKPSQVRASEARERRLKRFRRLRVRQRRECLQTGVNFRKRQLLNHCQKRW